MLIQENEIQQTANEVINMLNDEELENINKLYSALVEEDIEKIDTLLKIHVESVEGRFKTEENMMQEVRFPQFEAHKRDHDVMRKKLAKFLKRWEVLKGPNELRGFFEKDAKKWWTQHISRLDAQMALKLGHAEEY